MLSQRMSGLYSLDVSFCAKLTTIRGLTRPLKERCNYSCRLLDLEGSTNGGNGHGSERQLVHALQSVREVTWFYFLDLRECQQQELFLKGMADLGFDEPMHGLFVRLHRWNGEVRMQLVANLS